MSRTAIALPLGLFGFLGYIALVVALADHVLGLHWTIEALYFTGAGVLWVFPALRLIRWAVAAP